MPKRSGSSCAMGGDKASRAVFYMRDNIRVQKIKNATAAHLSSLTEVNTAANMNREVEQAR